MKDFRQTKFCSLLCLILSLILLLVAGCGKTGPDGAGKDAPSDGGKGAVFSGTEIALPEGWTVVPAITPLLTGSEDRPVWIAAQKGETPAEYTVFALSAKGDPDGGPEEIARFSPSDRVQDAETVYDLQGRKITGHPSHGIYIINGKKNVIR